MFLQLQQHGTPIPQYPYAMWRRRKTERRNSFCNCCSWTKCWMECGGACTCAAPYVGLSLCYVTAGQPHEHDVTTVTRHMMGVIVHVLQKRSPWKSAVTASFSD